MIGKKLAALCSLAALFSFSSCTRSSSEMWEDTKTCSKHVGKGFSSLLGFNRKSGIHRKFSFVPLYEEEHMRSVSVSESDTKEEFVGYTVESSLRSPFQKINFDTDSYTIKGEHQIRYLQEIVEYMLKHPKIRLVVEGHTDERGTAAYNLALGVRRANSVKDFLVKKGISPDRIFPVSYGKERPLSSEHNEMCWRQNRRTEFKLNAK